MHTHFQKEWELLTSDGLKVIQVTGDGRLIISRIAELESKSKIEREHVLVKTMNFEDNSSINKG